MKIDGQLQPDRAEILSRTVIWVPFAANHLWEASKTVKVCPSECTYCSILSGARPTCVSFAFNNGSP